MNITLLTINTPSPPHPPPPHLPHPPLFPPAPHIVTRMIHVRGSLSVSTHVKHHTKHDAAPLY
eukprot:7753895-Pyramimonas_sp.AAC.1